MTTITRAQVSQLIDCLYFKEQDARGDERRALTASLSRLDAMRDHAEFPPEEAEWAAAVYRLNGLK